VVEDGCNGKVAQEKEGIHGQGANRPANAAMDQSPIQLIFWETLQQ